MSKEHLPSFRQSLTVLFLVIASIILSLSLSMDLVSALFYACIVATLASLYLKNSWSSIQKDLIRGISNGLVAILILIVIGAVIASWMASGTIPSLLVYGLKNIQPSVFLPAGFILASITSLFIGSSFGTIATVGIVLMGMGEVYGVPAAMTAGAVVSGAMLGDKLSPLSDSTNLTASIANVQLMDHVKSMLKVSVPVAFIVIVLYWLVNNQLDLSGAGQTSAIHLSMDLEQLFNINILNLFPIVVVLVLLFAKLPALPSLVISYLSAVLIAIFVQGVSIQEIISITTHGYISQSGQTLIDDLLSQGGILSMMDTIAVILLGTGMGGILEGSQILTVILDRLKTTIKNSFMLVFYTLASGYLMLMATGEMYVSIILPGKILSPAYDQFGMDRTVMSRALESSATLGCAIIPWGIVTKYAMDVLDVGYEFIPYAFFPLLVPIALLIVAAFNQQSLKVDKK